MKTEAEFKTTFKKSVKLQGGFSISLAAPMLSGIPDLYVIMPGFTPILLEAKWLGTVGKKFSRKIQYTKLQHFYLKECCKIRDYTAMGLVGYKRDNDYWCTLVHPSKDVLDNTSMDEHFSLYENKMFYIKSLFEYYPIPRLSSVYTTDTTDHDFVIAPSAKNIVI